MPFHEVVLGCVIAGFFSALMASCTFAYARHRLIDSPTERSSHRVSTPRGGGAAFIAVFSVATGIVAIRAVDADLWVLLVPGALVVAATGFVDDHVSLPARVRLVVHLAAAIWIVVLGRVDGLTLIGYALPAPVATCIAVLAIVWLLNLYNFMDGINGLASLEAIFVALAGAALEWNAGNGMGGTFLALLAATVAGFLPWNFPTAKIFMGDVGSGALGFVFGSFLVLAWNRGESHFFAWLTILATFVADASWTLFVRMVRRESIFDAHRTHAYQRAALKWGHTRVTMTFVLINCLWLLPLAGVAARFPESAPWCAFVAYFTVLSGVVWHRAGTAMRPPS